MGAELVHDTLLHGRRRTLLIFQRVRDAQLMPLRAAELVEWKHIDMLHRIAERFADPRHVLDVLLRGGEIRHKHEPYPDLLARLGEALSEIDGGLQHSPGHDTVGFLITGLHVKQTQVDIIDHFVRIVSVEEAGSVEAGVHAHLLGRSEHAGHECRLHHRLASR